jgi:hypothetical protein
MLMVVWRVLTNQVADREAVAELVAAKFLEWSWKLPGQTFKVTAAASIFSGMFTS